MPPVEAKRTLVKSPPEVWAQVSDVACLAEQLGAFGEIRITRAEPESIVEWEGDRASGTVRLESSGWGTKVTITAEVADAEPVAEIPSPGTADVPGPVESPSPVGDPLPPSPSPTPDPVPEPTPDPVPEPTPDPVPEPTPDPPETPDVEPPITEPAPAPPQIAKVGFFARLFGTKAKAAPAPSAAEAPPEPAPTADPSFNEVFEAVGTPPTPELIAQEQEQKPEPEPEPDPTPLVALDPDPLPEEEVDTPPESEIDAMTVLTDTLEHLGAAHHRPFSRG